MDVWFPTKSSAKESLEKIPMGINPTNQTTIVEKFPIRLNPPNFLCKFFESNMPWVSKAKQSGEELELESPMHYSKN